MGVLSRIVFWLGLTMSFDRHPVRDPRTVARDIPGVLDMMFPRLTSGLVNIWNRTAVEFPGVTPIPDKLVDRSSLMNAMLFELSSVRAESILSNGVADDWEVCLENAARRQKRHFDAKIPDKLETIDIEIANIAATNMVAMLRQLQTQSPEAIIEISPRIPGMGWIGSGKGDFAIGNSLVEVKHTEAGFRAADFRQVLMYWLLKFADSVQSEADVWQDILLLNPRRNRLVRLKSAYLIDAASDLANPVELIELLRSAVIQRPDER